MSDAAALKKKRAPDAEPADEVQQSLYAKREKIYPREVHGTFAGLRVWPCWSCSGCTTACPG